VSIARGVAYPIKNRRAEEQEAGLRGHSAPIAARVTVETPARLHLGFLDPSGELGRRFASLGLAIDALGSRITVRAAGRTSVEGPERERVERHLETLRAHLGLRGGHEVTVEAMTPTHAGLGSGTQIALAVAAGIRRLHGLPLDVRGDAVVLGRGGRSGIGIGAFERGGLMLDGGRGPDSRPPPIIARLHFPQQWCVILMLDPGRKGVHGPDEAAAFAALPPFPEAQAAHHCHLLLMKALPAVAEEDLTSFGAAVRELQSCVGDYFAPIQGGSRFASPKVAAALELLDRAGAHGIGQSSWGPTGFAFAPSSDEAARLVALLRGDTRLQGLDIRACAGLNRGAEIDVHPAVDAR
jgi:beta-ribofuranosylaminobenzene 5'-phosphate synthase